MKNIKQKVYSFIINKLRFSIAFQRYYNKDKVKCPFIIEKTTNNLTIGFGLYKVGCILLFTKG